MEQSQEDIQPRTKEPSRHHDAPDGDAADMKLLSPWKAVVVITGLLLLCAAVYIIVPTYREHYMIGVRHKSYGRTSSRGYGASDLESTRGPAPSEIQYYVNTALADPANPAIGAGPDVEDRTLLVLQFTLERTLWRKSRLHSLYYSVFESNRNLGVSEWHIAEDASLGESEEVFLRIRPDGSFYVSASEDYAGRIHDSSFPPGATTEQDLVDVLHTRWGQWMKRVDTILETDSTQER
jgi:hypothetical protein